jgi:hypothetical protein
MEEDLKYIKESPIELRVKRRLTSAIDKAQERDKYETAHNPELMRALQIVEQFLRKRQRVCYGGTAMNAILPPSKRFYNPELDLPDYDFFTPEMDKDIEDIVAMLRKAGFTDIYHKIGMHEGTKKILVNFTPIADITHISSQVYHVFLKRSVVRQGIHHTDPDILRMMMYLEISRPKGMVSRWEKVYERLQLINRVFPPAISSSHTRKLHKNERRFMIPPDIKNALFDFCINKQRNIFTGDLDQFYQKAVKSTITPHFDIKKYSGPIGFISPMIHSDAKEIQELLSIQRNAKGVLHAAKGEIVPAYIEILFKNFPTVLIFQETACHSYLSFPVEGGRSISICSPDTLISLYYSLSIFTKSARKCIPNIERQTAALVLLSEKNRISKNPNIPSFPLSCHGYQKGYSTLLRERLQRIKKEKGEDTSMQ